MARNDSPVVTLRPVTWADYEFLLRLYAATRERELLLLPWSDEQKTAFVRMQFDAQDRWYRERFPSACFDVIEIDGSPAGRLYVEWGETDVRIIDIAVAPEQRGRGIGTTLVQRVMAEARAKRRSASVHVAQENPAKRLYERLGFVDVEEHGMYTLMHAAETSSV